MKLTLGAVTGRMVKLENVGSTALFYKWERRPLESMGVTTPRRTLGWTSFTPFLLFPCDLFEIFLTHLIESDWC